MMGIRLQSNGLEERGAVPAIHVQFFLFIRESDEQRGMPAAKQCIAAVKPEQEQQLMEAAVYDITGSSHMVPVEAVNELPFILPEMFLLVVSVKVQ
jgi:hypothetical protein